MHAPNKTSLKLLLLSLLLLLLLSFLLSLLLLLLLFCFRRQRLAELKAAQEKARYGDVREISKDEYVREVNKAGDDVWVVLHIYKQG